MFLWGTRGIASTYNQNNFLRCSSPSHYLSLHNPPRVFLSSESMQKRWKSNRLKRLISKMSEMRGNVTEGQGERQWAGEIGWMRRWRRLVYVIVGLSACRRRTRGMDSWSKQLLMFLLPQVAESDSSSFCRTERNDSKHLSGVVFFFPSGTYLEYSTDFHFIFDIFLRKAFKGVFMEDILSRSSFFCPRFTHRFCTVELATMSCMWLFCNQFPKKKIQLVRCTVLCEGFRQVWTNIDT